MISGLDGPQGMTQDAAGDLLITSTFGESVETFANPPPSNVPASTLSRAATLLDFPIGIDVDAGGRMYVANEFGGLNVYADGASGSTAPLTVISGTATGLAAPGAVAVTPPLYILTTSLPSAVAGQSYRTRLYSLLGRPRLRWKLARGHLPRKLRLTRRGVITGIPKHAITRTFTVQVTDSTRPAMHARQTLTLTVAPAAVAAAHQRHRHMRRCPGQLRFVHGP